MKPVSEWADLCDRDGRHSFSKVTSFGSQLLVGGIVAYVLITGAHFQSWDVAALGVVVLTPHGYGLVKSAMKTWAWVKHPS